MREVLGVIKEGSSLGKTENGWGIKVMKNQEGTKCLNIGTFLNGELYGEAIQIDIIGWMYEG